jgi:hypothetical protein
MAAPFLFGCLVVALAEGNEAAEGSEGFVGHLDQGLAATQEN